MGEKSRSFQTTFFPAVEGKQEAMRQQISICRKQLKTCYISRITKVNIFFWPLVSHPDEEDDSISTDTGAHTLLWANKKADYNNKTQGLFSQNIKSHYSSQPFGRTIKDFNKHNIPSLSEEFLSNTIWLFEKFYFIKKKYWTKSLVFSLQTPNLPQSLTSIPRTTNKPQSKDLS